MQNRYTVFQRGAVFYCEDQTTGQQKSLRTRDEAEARRVVQAKNDAVALPQMNLVMAKTYLSAQNPKMITRTWADVLARFCERSNPNTRMTVTPSPAPLGLRPPSAGDGQRTDKNINSTRSQD
jgi:hypothetical protein